MVIYDLKTEIARAVRELTRHRTRVDANGPDTDAQIQRAIQEYISDGRAPWVARFRRVRSWWYKVTLSPTAQAVRLGFTAPPKPFGSDGALMWERRVGRHVERLYFYPADAQIGLEPWDAMIDRQHAWSGHAHDPTTALTLAHHAQTLYPKG